MKDNIMSSISTGSNGSNGVGSNPLDISDVTDSSVGYTGVVYIERQDSALQNACYAAPLASDPTAPDPTDPDMVVVDPIFGAENRKKLYQNSRWNIAKTDVNRNRLYIILFVVLGLPAIYFTFLAYLAITDGENELIAADATFANVDQVGTFTPAQFLGTIESVMSICSGGFTAMTASVKATVLAAMVFGGLSAPAGVLPSLDAAKDHNLDPFAAFGYAGFQGVLNFYSNAGLIWLIRRLIRTTKCFQSKEVKDIEQARENILGILEVMRSDYRDVKSDEPHIHMLIKFSQHVESCSELELFETLRVLKQSHFAEFGHIKSQKPSAFFKWLKYILLGAASLAIPIYNVQLWPDLKGDGKGLKLFMGCLALGAGIGRSLYWIPLFPERLRQTLQEGWHKKLWFVYVPVGLVCCIAGLGSSGGAVAAVLNAWRKHPIFPKLLVVWSARIVAGLINAVPTMDAALITVDVVNFMTRSFNLNSGLSWQLREKLDQTFLNLKAKVSSEVVYEKSLLDAILLSIEGNFESKIDGTSAVRNVCEIEMSDLSAHGAETDAASKRMLPAAIATSTTVGIKALTPLLDLRNALVAGASSGSESTVLRDLHDNPKRKPVEEERYVPPLVLQAASV